jgi:hypothetical protein
VAGSTWGRPLESDGIKPLKAADLSLTFTKKPAAEKHLILRKIHYHSRIVLWLCTQPWVLITTINE